MQRGWTLSANKRPSAATISSSWSRSASRTRSGPLSPCVAGDIVYVFVNGDVAVCPYLVFAARTPQSQYEDQEFLAGNILEHDIAETIDGYNFAGRFQMGTNAQCATCSLNKSCGKGCPAAVVAAGQRIGDRDVEVCPLP